MERKREQNDPRRGKRRPASLVLVALLLLVGAGCGGSAAQWKGPAQPVPVEAGDWKYSGREGKVLLTPHYQVHTTVQNAEVVARLPQVMEGAYAQYQVFAGNVPESDRPMKCYVFGKRDEWADFTQKHTGADARVYLQITRGGYTVGDWFVSYYVGGDATYSVAAHEGWHQFVARHFKGRLPPFLEEGTACMFESVRFSGELPRWDLTINPSRTLSLRNSIEANKLWPLDKLVTMHAGDVVKLPGDRIEAFYSQSWAFARFMTEYENGKYLPAFRQLMKDTAAGNSRDQTQSLRKALNLWSPAAVRPLLEHYLGKDLREVEEEYDKFIKHIAYDQFHKQWTEKPK